MNESKDKALDLKLERREKHDHKKQQEREREERYDDLPDNIYHKLYR